MSTFNAFRIHNDDAGYRSGIESLTLDALNPGEVVIKTAYSSVNYKDALAGTGEGKILRRFPLVGGIDVAGHVVASTDPAFKEGDAVLVTGSGLSETRDGGYADYARLDAKWVIPLPTGLSLRESMILGTAGFTAALALYRMRENRQTPDLGPLAVTGATGGVGSLAVDIFSRTGFEVHAGIAQLFKANKVTAYYGFGQLQPGNVVKVKQHDGSDVELKGTNVIIAAGSDSIELPFAKFDGETIVDNVGALDFTEVPKRLAVIGAGVIGLELGSVWKRLGAEVTILEALPDFLAVADSEVSKVAAREFKKQGLDIRLGAKVSKTEVTGKGKKKEVVVTYSDAESEKTLTVDKLLVAVGRRAASKGLLAEGTGVKLNERGQVEVDAHCHTGVDGVWAIGDCVRGPMLAHKGFEEGIAVAELIAGLPGHVNFDTIPWVIYTSPEIAWVGKTEQQLKAEGVAYKAGSFPFAAVGRAVAMAEPSGFVKVIADAETDRVLGMHLVGANVSELVHEGVLTMEFKGSADDLARICHAHPSLSEAVHDAAMAVHKRAIHKAN